MGQNDDIKRLLDLYFSGHTSEEDEQLLLQYFTSAEVDPELAEWQSYFVSLQALQREAAREKEDRFAEQLRKLTVHTAQSRKRNFMHWALPLAASALLCVFLLLPKQQAQPSALEQDTYENPDEALQQTREVLAYVSSKLNRSRTPLIHLEKLTSSMNHLNKIDLIHKKRTQHEN